MGNNREVSTHEPRQIVTEVAEADPDLDQELSDHLDEFNQAATAGLAPARELTVQVRDTSGELVGGISGWTWGDAGGMGMAWVHPDSRCSGVGSRLLGDFAGATGWVRRVIADPGERSRADAVAVTRTLMCLPRSPV